MIVFIVVDMSGMFREMLWVSLVLRLVLCGRMLEKVGMRSMLLKVSVFWIRCMVNFMGVKVNYM